MKLTIDIPDTLCEKVVRGIFDNYPEASTPSLQCTDYDYDKFRFNFTDCEEDCAYVVDLPMAMKGFRLFLEARMTGKLAGVSWSWNMQNEDDLDYDAETADAILQFSLFGEVLYG